MLNKSFWSKNTEFFDYWHYCKGVRQGCILSPMLVIYTTLNEIPFLLDQGDKRTPKDVCGEAISSLLFFLLLFLLSSGWKTVPPCCSQKWTRKVIFEVNHRYYGSVNPEKYNKKYKYKKYNPETKIWKFANLQLFCYLLSSTTVSSNITFSMQFKTYLKNIQ